MVNDGGGEGPLQVYTFETDHEDKRQRAEHAAPYKRAAQEQHPKIRVRRSKQPGVGSATGGPGRQGAAGSSGHSDPELAWYQELLLVKGWQAKGWRAYRSRTNGGKIYVQQNTIPSLWLDHAREQLGLNEPEAYWKPGPGAL